MRQGPYLESPGLDQWRGARPRLQLAGCGREFQAGPGACPSVCPHPRQLLGAGTKEAENWRIWEGAGDLGLKQ